MLRALPSLRVVWPLVIVFDVLATALGCTDSAKISESKAVPQVERLAKLADDDVEEVRRGLPLGAKSLGQMWQGTKAPFDDPNQARRALDRVRDEHRDLAIAKSTFFALTDDKGAVLRSDQEPDQMAGRSLTASYPELAKVLAGQAIETRRGRVAGSMHHPRPRLAAGQRRRDERRSTPRPALHDRRRLSPPERVGPARGNWRDEEL